MDDLNLERKTVQRNWCCPDSTGIPSLGTNRLHMLPDCPCGLWENGQRFWGFLPVEMMMCAESSTASFLFPGWARRVAWRRPRLEMRLHSVAMELFQDDRSTEGSNQQSWPPSHPFTNSTKSCPAAWVGLNGTWMWPELTPAPHNPNTWFLRKHPDWPTRTSKLRNSQWPRGGRLHFFNLNHNGESVNKTGSSPNVLLLLTWGFCRQIGGMALQWMQQVSFQFSKVPSSTDSFYLAREHTCTFLCEIFSCLGNSHQEFGNLVHLVTMASGGESTRSFLPPTDQSWSMLTHISKGLIYPLDLLLLGGHV